jgi:ribonuclease T2
MKLRVISTLLAVIGLATPAAADKYDGFFIAQQSCPAFQSFNNQTNPGNIMVQLDHSYRIIERNKPSNPSHYRLIVPGVSPEERWVAVSCGLRTVSDGGAPAPTEPDQPDTGTINPLPTAPATWNVLSASWQPAFCETSGGYLPNSNTQKPECASQTTNRPDATHFALHGLWPQPFEPKSEYCGYTRKQADGFDDIKDFGDFDAVTLTPATWAVLNAAMPGTQSKLERHEWTKHGTCYGKSQDDYFTDSALLLDKLNATTLDEFFVQNLGKTVKNADIRAKFDEIFGAGAGNKVGIGCSTEKSGGRTVLTELRIHIKGSVSAASDLGSMILAGDDATNDSCHDPMIIDAVGIQP